MVKKRFIVGIIIVSLIVAIAAVVVVGIQNTSSRNYEIDIRESGAAMQKTSWAPEISLNLSAPQQKKVIKTSYISLEVKNYYATADALDALAQKYRGYISNVSAQDYGGRMIGTIIIRVPSEHFKDIIQDIGEIGDLQEQNISLEDVTEEYVDLTARLENLKQQEERYREILDIAVTVEDVLKVETQLERIRGEIESLQGRINYLDNKIQYSTVQIRLSEPETIIHEARIRHAFSRAIDGFLATIRGIIIFTGYFIPIVIFLVILGLAGRFFYVHLFKK